MNNKKMYTFGILAFLIAIVSLSSANDVQEQFVSGDFWNLNGNTVVLNNSNYNVNIGENFSTTYKLKVTNGNTLLNNSILTFKNNTDNIMMSYNSATDSYKLLFDIDYGFGTQKLKIYPSGTSASILNVYIDGNIESTKNLVVGDMLQVEGKAYLNDNLEVSGDSIFYGDIHGERETLSVWFEDRISTTKYVKQYNLIVVNRTDNFELPYDGCVRSISALLYTDNQGIADTIVNISAFVNNVYKGGLKRTIPVFGGYSLYEYSETFERGAYPFNSEQTLGAYITFGAGVWGANGQVQVSIEVQYDD